MHLPDDDLGRLLGESQKKARRMAALGQEIEDKMKPLFVTGIIINEDLRQARLGDKNGGNGDFTIRLLMTQPIRMQHARNTRHAIVRCFSAFE